MSGAVPRNGRMRWLKNVVLYVIVVGAFVLGLGGVAAVTQGVGDPGGAIAGLIFVTSWLATAGLIALVPFLVVVELNLRHGRRRRLAAVVLGAIIPSAALVLSQVGHPMSVTPQSILVVLAVAIPGAAFGTLAQLPPLATGPTLADAE